MTADRSAVGILLDSVELMIARDVGTGRDINAMRTAFSAIAEVLGVKPPATVDELRRHATELVARANAAPRAPSASEEQFRSGCEGLQRAAREWFNHHPYEDDQETDAAFSYFDSFGKALGPAAAKGTDAVFAGLLRDLLNGQGVPTLEDPAQIRVILSNLRTDAVAHRSKMGATAEVSTLRSKVTELEAALGEARDRIMEVEAERDERPRRRAKNGSKR